LSPGKSDQHPALIAPFANDPTAPVDAVHLTLLADGNGKANVESAKIVVGRPLGRPIILAPGNDTLALAVTEGIEDGLSVHAATGLEVWAAGSSAFMPALADAIPDFIETVTIYAHSDKAGQVGAIELAEKLIGVGVEVFTEGLAA
jgi:Toprim domain